MNKRIIFSVMLVFLLAFVAVMAFSQSSQNARWEYTAIRSLDLSSSEAIRIANELGQQGWELVTNARNRPEGEYLILKRRLP